METKTKVLKDTHGNLFIRAGWAIENEEEQSNYQL
jgi:hypothetical protein